MLTLAPDLTSVLQCYAGRQMVLKKGGMTEREKRLERIMGGMGAGGTSSKKPNGGGGVKKTDFALTLNTLVKDVVDRELGKLPSRELRAKNLRAYQELVGTNRDLFTAGAQGSVTERAATESIYQFLNAGLVAHTSGADALYDERYTCYQQDHHSSGVRIKPSGMGLSRSYISA